MKKGMVAFAFIMGIVLISLLATIDPGIFSFLRYIPGGDKLGHFFLFGIATLLVTSALAGSRSYLWGGLLVTGLVVIEESMQLFFASRSFSFLDLFASLLGVLAFSIYCYVHSTTNAT